MAHLRILLPYALARLLFSIGYICALLLSCSNAVNRTLISCFVSVLITFSKNCLYSGCARANNFSPLFLILILIILLSFLLLTRSTSPCFSRLSTMLVNAGGLMNCSLARSTIGHGPDAVRVPVSYTHLTLPTTPYV